MARSRPNISSPPFPPPSNDDLGGLSSSELISFLESSFRRSEFNRVASILKSREELAKDEAVKDLSAKLSHLEAKNGSLEKEIMKEKGRYLLLRGSYEKMEKLAQEKIGVLMEEVEKERAKQLELETARNERIAEIDSWKSKYSSLEAWILRFLENNPRLMEKVREQDMNGCKAAGELLGSNAASDKKESFSAARAKSNAVIDISGSDIQLDCDSFENKGSAMKYSIGSSGNNCSSKRKFQIAETSVAKGVLELDDEDDVICVSELMVKRSNYRKVIHSSMKSSK